MNLLSPNSFTLIKTDTTQLNTRITMNHIVANKWKWTIHGLAWTVFFGIGLVFFMGVYDWQWALFYSSLNISILMFLFYCNGYLIDQLWEKKQFLLYAVSFLGLLFITILIRWTINTHFLHIVPPTPVFSPQIRLLFFSITTTVTILGLSFFYRVLLNRYERERQYLVLINQHNEAQLQLLKNQINPHFLFNTLNNIYSLTVVKSPQAPKMILLLSDLLRYVIYESQSARVDLEMEITHLKKFIDLFQMRNEFPQNVQLQVEGDITHWQIEPMILIPLAENCFKHCDFDSNDQGFIKITISASQQGLQFNTENSFTESNQQKDKIGGVGLENIRKRLAMRYPDKHTLHIHKTTDTFIVQLQLPA
ncbi:sensor histidine kinase [Cytophagaceae bacterium YF14B1]|uniref:Sensor histidine kinase n=1 Tax=Xanthocytophaga flava TaxID=3048013 RepID=A0AAE3QW32_9BACT|nr:sensor histidine kinase [Xanthocytophaga flavus]MDJ1484535.1 sensor histidine kinase [Xanthocytophaga flavus]